eukprot:7427669-Pyramimonas_sp.AAC.1
MARLLNLLQPPVATIVEHHMGPWCSLQLPEVVPAPAVFARAAHMVTDPYLNLFRNLIPPIMGQIDMTPLLGFLVLQFLANVLGTDDII